LCKRDLLTANKQLELLAFYKKSYITTPTTDETVPLQGEVSSVVPDCK